MLTEWIFTNKCTAYVDADGIALEGEALKRARQDGHARRCGHRVVIGAKCCSMCGAPAPGGWWTCARCGKHIGNDSAVCSYCGTEQNLAYRAQLKAGIWHPEENVFAQRFELNAYKDGLGNGLEVQTGQIVILLANGAVSNWIRPGSYSFEDLRKIADKNNANDHLAIIFVHSGALDIPVQLEDLRTKEGMGIQVTMSLQFAFLPENCSDFVSNIMSNSMMVSGHPTVAILSIDAMVRNLFLGEMEIIVRRLCFNHTVEELYMQPEFTLELEKQLTQKFSERLQSTGLRFLNIGKVMFTGKVIESLQETAGSIEGLRREMEYRLRVDELTKSQDAHLAGNDIKHEQYLKQLAHEMEISDATLSQELARFRENNQVERKLAELEEKYRLASKELNDVAQLERLQDQFDEERKLITKNGEIARRQAEHNEMLRQRHEEMIASDDYEKLKLALKKLQQENEHKYILDWLEEQKLALAVKTQDDLVKGEAMNSWNIQTLVALAKSPAHAQMLLDYSEQQRVKDLTPEQLLAWGAAHGKNTAAEAMKVIAQTREGGMYERILKQTREEYARSLERDERLFAKAVEGVKGSGSPVNPAAQLFR